MPLLLRLPAAEPLVDPWRAEHDWAAAHGIPAHVTVRMPFLAPEEWGDPRIHEVVAPFLPLPLTLARLEDRPGALVVLVEPDAELRRVTAAVDRAWPSLPPHKDGRRDVAYHVTVVRTPDPDVRAAAEDAIAPQLPLAVTATEAWAAERTPDGGVVHTRFVRPTP